MNRLTFRQNLDRDGEWVVTLDHHFNSVGWCKDCAVRNLQLWMKKNHMEALSASQHVFDAYLKPKVGEGPA